MEREEAIEVVKKNYPHVNESGSQFETALRTLIPELAESEDERIRKALVEGFKRYDDGALFNGCLVREIVACLEKQNSIMKCLQIANARIGELIEENYYLKEKQGEHAKFYDSIQVGDKVTRNEDGVLVNLSQLKRVAKPAEVQGEQKPVQEIEPTPIFKIGDILKRKCKDYTFRVDRIQGGYYHCDHNHGAFFPIEEQDNWELVEQKPADKVEPKFHEGDWVVSIVNGNIYHVINAEDSLYLMEHEGERCTFPWKGNDDILRAWNIIQDAKDGDVLADGNLPFIFKKIDSNKYSYAYCGISVDDGFKIESDGESGEWTWTQDIKPATKEQCDTLMKAMADAGYTFDFEKKELKKIEQKPAWSEEDERLCQCLIQDQEEALDKVSNDKYGHSEIVSDLEEMYKERISWLKSLKERIYPKQEWSKEDEKILNLIIARLHSHPNVEAEEYDKDYHWLKSLKDRYTWKPSDEQIIALENLLGLMNPKSIYGKGLVSLLEQLKKLREE